MMSREVLVAIVEFLSYDYKLMRWTLIKSQNRSFHTFELHLIQKGNTAIHA